MAIRCRTHRSLSPVLGATWLLLGLLSGACEDKMNEQRDARLAHRKALLAAEDRRAQREQKYAQTRVQDAQGELIPSGEKVAGIELPRGLKLRLGFAREWYYETTLPAEAVRAYFGPRLDTAQVVPGAAGTITYVNALPRDTPNAERVNVRIGPLPKQRGKTEINIRLQTIVRPPASEAEARLELEKRTKFAE